jgi:hypothetical protein
MWARDAFCYHTFCKKKKKSPSHTSEKKLSPQTPYISLHSYYNTHIFLIFANMEKVVERILLFRFFIYRDVLPFVFNKNKDMKCM